MNRTKPTAATLALRAGAFTMLLTPLASGEIVYGVTSTQRLVSFDSSAPGTILTNVAIGGAQSGETIRGIDFRPLTGQLYALGSSSRLYTVHTTTGALTQVGAGTFSPGLNGAQFGFDFNPTIDRIRVVSDQDQNTVLNPITGGGTMATSVFYAAADPNAGVNPSIVGSAYDRNFNGGVTSQLYGIDSGLNILVRQANSAGTLNTVGGLGVDFGADVGFDISPFGRAFATNSSSLAAQTSLYRIDLMTGGASLVGTVGNGLSLDAIAVTPAPASLGLLGMAGLVSRRRR